LVTSDFVIIQIKV